MTFPRKYSWSLVSSVNSGWNSNLIKVPCSTLTTLSPKPCYGLYLVAQQFNNSWSAYEDAIKWFRTKCQLQCCLKTVNLSLVSVSVDLNVKEL
ncbi:MAG: hypothetical protein XD54_0601 [Thermococcus sibiricus]|uniref:Uncharacterized protein n=1 Tax=Thermococcus sibiricus TaxID=172049 RepID=A0A101EMY3_9EURY|nr:MAG: hypothetical protein XD54_0601 [Thermococcus sibiricus]